MMLLITYCPEMNVYTVEPERGPKRIVIPDDFAPGAKFESLAPVFNEARQAVESGRAVMGIHVTI